MVQPQQLSAALAQVRQYLEQHARAIKVQETTNSPAEGEPPEAVFDENAFLFSPLDRIRSIFGLSTFERDVLVLCAGMELDTRFPALCAAAQDDAAKPYPTFALALAVLPEPHWSALLPDSPLRRWRLIEVESRGNVPMTLSLLRIDERVLHYLKGVQHLDERLAGLVTTVQISTEPTASQWELARRLADLWSTPAAGPLPVVQLCGGAAGERDAVAASACVELYLGLYRLAAQHIPASPSELEALLRLWERESALADGALLLDCAALGANDLSREQSLIDFIERARFPLIVSGDERRRTREPLITFDVPRASLPEQRAAWEEMLGADPADERVDPLVSQFSLNPAQIRTAVRAAQGDAEALWNACRIQARPRLDDLAQPIESGADWEALVLPDAPLQTLHEIAANVRQRHRVYERWGFANGSDRGLGISALFAGPSGTGKTLAAEVLANELKLDLYRIDLSQVVSKYIGETEKNLRRVFEAAESGGAVLLFDEADALFGKRSEVKDSHDRYANIEVSYLLQRMEAYRGLAILTTNQKQALDPAFLRRLRFVVNFPFPDATQRERIWRQVFPSGAPINGVDYARLAQLNVAGGNIRNIALGAAFLAADEEASVAMKHLLHAARSECAKIEKPLSETEIGGWV